MWRSGILIEGTLNGLTLTYSAQIAMLSTKLHTSSTFHALISSIFIWHFRVNCVLPACSLLLLVVLLLLDVLKPDVDADNWLLVVVTLGDVACCCLCVSVDVGDNFIRFASGGVLDELRSSGEIPVIGFSLIGLRYGSCVVLVDEAVTIGGAGGDRVDSWWSAWRFERAGNGLKLLKLPKFGICVDVDGKELRLESFRGLSASLINFCISASWAALACWMWKISLINLKVRRASDCWKFKLKLQECQVTSFWVKILNTYKQHKCSRTSHIEHGIKNIILIKLETGKKRREEILIWRNLQTNDDILNFI